MVVPGAGGVPLAGGGAEALWLPEPGTAANATHIAVTTGPRRAIGGRPVIVAVIAILHPLPHVARHVVEAERIGLERIDR